MRGKLGLILLIAAMLLLVPIAAGAQHAGFVAAGIAPPAPAAQAVSPTFAVAPVLPAMPQWSQWSQWSPWPQPVLAPVNPPVIIHATGPVIVQQGPIPVHHHGIPNHVSIPVITPGLVVIQTAPVSTFGTVAPAQVVQAPVTVIVGNGKHGRTR